ncbi:SGNH/GDSL hydrolase family protein [Rhodococcus sp. X156]|uniref:SGNH/GDSL hydrolase family protein n=1 Tax=Rhodococcus sp. X156 TaxID=2499145 RepID=UPI000FD89851|nr:SGNH/GDSL hydrolase family protein [Rhodococcus sp. X156]
MNIRRLAGALAVALAAAATSQAAATAAPQPTTYLLSLGDSLSVGYQPAHDGQPAGDTEEGYADKLYAQLKVTEPTLELVKLGCTGETTTTMIEGGRCTYDGAVSQLEAAKTFLRNHPGQVRYITNDIGANDVQKCAQGGSIDIRCAVDGLGTISKNLPRIVLDLNVAAVTSHPVFVGMNYYNPFLASYLDGGSGVFTAALTSLFSYAVNSVQGAVYSGFGVRVADVSAAFDSYRFLEARDLPGVGPVPLPVYQICTLTYMCTDDPDIHANPAGYQVIADAFAAQLPRTQPQPALVG